MDVTIQNAELWEKGQEFLRDCEGKRTHIIHDYDVDGISGGLILLHTLRRLGAESSASTRQGRGAPMHHEELARIKDDVRPERLIITDQDPKSFHHWEGLRATFPDIPLLIVDHHFVQTYAPDERVVFVHPELVYGVDGSKYPSAKLVFDLCQSVRESEDLAWLACLGILGDAGTERFMDFLARVAGEHDLEMPSDPYTSVFGKIAEAIECCSTASEEELLGYLSRLKEQETLEGARKLGNPCQYIRDEVDSYLERGLDLAETVGPVTFLKIESEYGIAGWVMTLISLKHPDRIFIGYREQVDGTSLSGRCQHADERGIHLGKLLKPVTESLGGGGGGHAPAAGGFVPHGKWEEFLQKFPAVVERALEEHE